VAIRFIHPWLLCLIPLVVYPVYLWHRDNQAMAAFRRRLIVVLRLLLMLCLILALAGTQINYRVNRQSVVFVVDLSASCGNAREKAESFISQALQHKESEDRAAIIAFGENARIEQALGGQGFQRLETIVAGDRTNLEEALKLAGALLPGDSRRRIVLLSDGRENDGDARREAERLADRQVTIDAWPLAGQNGPDVRIDSLQAPARMFAGEDLSLKLKINSNMPTTALLRIYQNQTPVREETISLNRGDNAFTYPLTAANDGLQTFKATIEVKKDRVAENNEAAAYTIVKGPPRVLVVEGRPGEAGAITSALQSLHMPVDISAPGQIDPGLEEFSPYSLTILCDVPAEELASGVMESIQSAVRDLGMGLIMVGGEESFGPGGYLNTPVEQALPVHMDLRGKKKIPSLGLVLVIDKSGSMSETSGGVCKVDLAKDAAAQAVSVLTGKDRVGVVAFDSVPKWVIKPQAASDQDTIISDIGTIRADGGTSIFPALQLAYNGLKDSRTKYKHIIVMTDGMSGDAGDYYFLTRRMENQGITLSTVAVGKDADTNLLSQLAEWGQGRYYYCDDARKVPRIFTKETIKARRDYLVEEDFYPALGENSPLLQGIDALPLLHGYVGTSPKASGQVVLLSKHGDPILAQWQYGLGRAVAYTTDAGGRWGTLWAAWPGFNRLWANIVSWSLPRSDPENALSFNVNIDGTEGEIRVESRDYTRNENLTAVIASPDFTRREIKLPAAAPGIYRAAFPASSPGIYLVNLLRDGRDNVSVATAAVALPYSPEYRYSGVNTSFLAGLTHATGGKIIGQPADAFAENLPTAQGGVELWFWLLLAAGLLLLLDIAARRLAFTREDIQRAWKRLTGSKPTAESTAPVITERLRARQDASRQASGQRHTMQPGEQTNGTVAHDDKPRPASVSTPAKNVAPPKPKQSQGAVKEKNISRLLEARKKGHE